MKKNDKATLSGVEERKKVIKNGKELISRKEAIIKTGKYAALTALATFTILSPKKAQAQSTPDGTGW